MIPYGCMATGVNSGMIEVVADAQTIAKVLVRKCCTVTALTLGVASSFPCRLLPNTLLVISI